MLLFGGIVAVLAAVGGGYLWEGGKLGLLNQPAEFTIIAGSALGILLVSTPMPVVLELINQLKRILAPAPTRQDYADLLMLQYQLFRTVQSGGLMTLEPHFDNPHESSILSKYPAFLKRHASLAFLADSIRVIIVGGIAPHDFEHLMYEDLELRQKQQLLPSATLMKVGDALPGLGIVAAVLGVVITMQAIDGAPSEIGHKVGSALIGTFLGIFLSYGFFQPIATTLEHRVNDEMCLDQCIKAGVLALHKGFAPAVAIEFARRVIPEDVRPTFEETEALCRSAREASVTSAAA